MDIVAIVLATIIAGTITFNYVNDVKPTSTPVPVIQAETTPTKVEPAVEQQPVEEPAKPVEEPKKKKKAKKKQDALPKELAPARPKCNN